MRTCVATDHANLSFTCEKPATKCLRFLCVGNEPLINLVQSCDGHAKMFEECDAFLGYTEAAECAFCAKAAKWEMFVRHRDDDHEEERFAAVCEEHRRAIKENGGHVSLKVGDKATLPPHYRVTLQETGREVLVDENEVIFGTQGDTMTAELLVDQKVEWVDDVTVKLKGEKR